MILLKKDLKVSPQRNPKKSLRLLGLTKNDIIPNEIIDVSKFNIFGFPLSTDLDILILLNNQEQIIKYKHKTDKLNMDIINNHLDKLGYSNKELDINLFTYDINNNNIFMTLKCGKETKIFFLKHTNYIHKYIYVFSKLQLK